MKKYSFLIEDAGTPTPTPTGTPPATPAKKSVIGGMKDRFMNGGYMNAAGMGAAAGGIIGAINNWRQGKGLFSGFLKGASLGSMGGMAAKMATGGNSQYRSGYTPQQQIPV